MQNQLNFSADENGLLTAQPLEGNIISFPTSSASQSAEIPPLDKKINNYSKK